MSQQQRALKILMDKEAFDNPKWKEQQTRANRAGCHPQIIEFERKLIKDFRKRGIPMFCHTMMRDETEQQRLYDAGYSNAPPGESAHQTGRAADIVHSWRGWELSPDDRLQKMAWAIVGHIGYELANRIGVPIQWGGDWDKPWDPAHWELQNWRHQ